MTAANFTLIPHYVTPEEPDFTTIITQSEGMKKQYQSLTTTPTQRFKLYFKAISNADYWTIYNHYYSCYGPYDSFSWTSVPDWIDLFTNDLYTTLTYTGSDFVTNGAFTANTANWTAVDATLASVAGGEAGNCLQITRTGESLQSAYQAMSGLTIGKIYRFSSYVKSGTSGNEAFYLSNGVSTETGTSSASWVYYKLVFRATATSYTCSVVKNTATAGTMLFDTVQLYNVTQNITGRWVKGSLNASPLEKERWNVDIVFERAV